MINARGMYLRPGNLLKDFQVMKVETRIQNGTPVEQPAITGTVLKGCLAAATPEEKLRWDQPQHPVTHSIIQAGKPKAEVGCNLLREGKIYQIHGVNTCSDLGIATVYYVEERGDCGA